MCMKRGSALQFEQAGVMEEGAARWGEKVHAWDSDAPPTHECGGAGWVCQGL